jgi:hypothetical protein
MTLVIAFDQGVGSGDFKPFSTGFCTAVIAMASQTW